MDECVCNESKIREVEVEVTQEKFEYYKIIVINKVDYQTVWYFKLDDTNKVDIVMHRDRYGKLQDDGKDWGVQRLSDTEILLGFGSYNSSKYANFYQSFVGDCKEINVDMDSYKSTLPKVPDCIEKCIKDDYKPEGTDCVIQLCQLCSSKLLSNGKCSNFNCDRDVTIIEE